MLKGESPEDAWSRLRLDEREVAWHAAQGLGCQAAAAGGLLGVPGGAVGCVGHLVTGGVVLRADDATGVRKWDEGGWGNVSASCDNYTDDVDHVNAIGFRWTSVLRFK